MLGKHIIRNPLVLKTPLRRKVIQLKNSYKVTVRTESYPAEVKLYNYC